jgi:hypothetical protein
LRKTVGLDPDDLQLKQWKVIGTPHPLRFNWNEDRKGPRRRETEILVV